MPLYESLRGDLRVDVAIVGAGITGITAALLLAEKGRRVAVLEQETVAGGESGNAAAHVTEAIDARYHYIKRLYGKEEARLVAEASRAAVAKIDELVQRFSIDCHFRRLPGYLYTEKRRYVGGLKNEASTASEAGLEAQYVTGVPLPFDTRGAVLFPNQAQLHPREYVAGLARHAVAAGAQIFDRTAVTRLAPDAVETGHGRVTADHVFLATDLPMNGFTGEHAVPYRTYLIAYAEHGTPPDGFFRDTADPYHYTLWQETEEGIFRIVGGEDHPAAEDADADACFERLASYSRQYYGDAPERCRWSARVVEPHGGMPLIGRANGVWISTGYARQGMTFGTAGAMLVSDLILGVTSPWAAVFDPMRERPHMSSRQFVTDNLGLPAIPPATA